jgi:hypothetical protein
VAHMPEIAREIQKSGFHLSDSREFVAIRFRSRTTPHGPGGGMPGGKSE